jgi:hypothetical protein
MQGPVFHGGGMTLSKAKEGGVDTTQQKSARGLAERKGLLPSTWIGRGVRLEYLDGYQSPIEASGVLLDTYPVGAILNLNGAWVCLPWERLVLVELVED